VEGEGGVPEVAGLLVVVELGELVVVADLLTVEGFAEEKLTAGLGVEEVDVLLVVTNLLAVEGLAEVVVVELFCASFGEGGVP